MHFEISAKTGDNINELFVSIIEQLNEKTANFKIMDLLEQNEQQELKSNDVSTVKNSKRAKVRL